MVYNRLQFKIPSVDVRFDVTLPGAVNVVSGDSATGKSLFVKCISLAKGANAVSPVKLYPDISDNILCFDYASMINIIGRVDEGNVINNLLDHIQKNKNCLIVLDNADLYLKGNNALVQYINFDSSNQYLIFSRGSNNIRADYEHRGVMTEENGVITVKYNKRSVGWL